MGAAGYGAYEIAELMGHADIKTSRRYAHPVSERKQAALEATRRGAAQTCHSPATEAEQPPKLDLRRTGATRLGEGGTDAFYITAILGHADVNTSQVYTIATNEGLRRAMESLTKRRGPTVTEVPTNAERPPEPAAVSA